MKYISFDKLQKEKKSVKEFDENLFNIKNQINLINQIYLENEIQEKPLILREIQNKIMSYKHQDIEKNILTNNLINIDETIEKLVISKLKCNYCKKSIFIIYKYVREELQWTLDRIDNSIGHTNNNTVICCLKCNLEKKCRSYDAFKFTKQLKINKIS
jgi:hypothetical protein